MKFGLKSKSSPITEKNSLKSELSPTKKKSFSFDQKSRSHESDSEDSESSDIDSDDETLQINEEKENKSVESDQWIEAKTIMLDAKSILPKRIHKLSYQLYDFIQKENLLLPLLIGEFPHHILFRHYQKSHPHTFKKIYDIELNQPKDFDEHELLDSFLKLELKAKPINKSSYEINENGTQHKKKGAIINIHLTSHANQASKSLNNDIKLCPLFNKSGNLIRIKILFNTSYFKNESILEVYFKTELSRMMQILANPNNIPLVLLNQLHNTGCSLQKNSDKKNKIIVVNQEHFTKDPYYILHILKLAFEYHLLLSARIEKLAQTCAATSTYSPSSSATWHKLLADLQFLLLTGHTYDNFRLLFQYGLISILFPGAANQVQHNLPYQNFLQQNLRYLEKSSMTEPNINLFIDFMMVGELLEAKIDLKEISQDPDLFDKIEIIKQFESIQKGRFNFLFHKMKKIELIQITAYVTTLKVLESPQEKTIKLPTPKRASQQTISQSRWVLNSQLIKNNIKKSNNLPPISTTDPVKTLSQ